MPIPLRTVHSFVRRQGRMTANQEAAFKNLWQKYGLAHSNKIIELEQTFNQKAPVILEIGFGMGHSLLQMAKENPGKNFIGIEVHRPGIGALLHGMQIRQIENIRLFCADAVEVLQQNIPNNSLEALHLFFPDPWPKRRHHKRRLVQADFLQLVHSKLKVSGIVHFATDWEDYASHALNLLKQTADFANTSLNNNYSPRPDYRPLTKYEQRGQRLGHQVWDIIFKKI